MLKLVQSLRFGASGKPGTVQPATTGRIRQVARVRSPALERAHAPLSAAVSLRVADYYTQGPRSFFRLHEKDGRYNVVPAHHTAQEYVDAYLEAARIGEDRRGPPFRSCEPGRRDALQDRAMSRLSAFKMIKRRVRKAGLPAEICAHSFRGTGITEYLRNGGDLEVAARIAGHESTRTTQLYNRLQEEISLDEIEQIHI